VGRAREETAEKRSKVGYRRKTSQLRKRQKAEVFPGQALNIDSGCCCPLSLPQGYEAE
jgi:hypothetical protein